MKRPCPWEVDQQPMVKVHHSEKDQTVKTAGGMETIYAKTLAMLFNGANKKGPENNNQESVATKPLPSAGIQPGNAGPACVSCVRMSQVPTRHRCVSCSGPVCEDCHQVCVSCQQIACGNCSVLNQMCGSVCLGCRD